MTALARIFHTHRLIGLQRALIKDQSRLINQQTDHLQRVHLEHARELRGLVSAWLLQMEQPEIDVRHELVQLDSELGDRIAVLEELIV